MKNAKIKFLILDMNNLIFFTSPIGLGHTTRDIAIAQHFANQSVKFFSGEAATKLFLEYGFSAENVYTPPSFDVHDGKLQNPLRWLLKYYSYYKDCKTISTGIIQDKNPNLVIGDEDFASLSIAHKKNLKTVLITDILESKFTNGLGSIIEKRMNRSMKSIIKKCNVIIIPENGSNENNIIRVGPIVRKTSHSREELRKKFSFDKKTIVLSVGGTNAGKFLIEKTTDAFKKLTLDADLIIISGPSLKIPNNEFKNLGFVNNLHEIIYAADLVISLAGKSTIDEAKSFGTPGIFVPIKGHFEQEENAKKAGFSFEDQYNLESLIPQKLEESRNPKIFDGAQKAAKLIENLL